MMLQVNGLIAALHAMQHYYVADQVPKGGSGHNERGA